MGGLSISTNLQINSRIRVGNELATIKYIGEVKDYQGLWIGVEWDNEERGKHNGTINGVKYFDTSYPRSGSMIRQTKLAPFESVRQAIETRYIFSPEQPIDDDLMKEAQRNMRATKFEIVGVEKIRNKQSRWEDLYDISLAQSNVSFADDLSLLNNLNVLDLTATLIWNWKIVASIVEQLHNLKYLNLSENRLQLPNEDDILECESRFKHLQNINLRNCCLDNWQHVQQIAKLFPNIESISLQDNKITRIFQSNCNEIFTNLKCLDLQRNNLSNFDEIIKLGNIKTLERLIIVENNIEHIEFPSKYENSNGKLTIFQNLMDLHIRDNKIIDEEFVFNELDKLPALVSLSYNRYCVDDKLSKKQNITNNFEEMFSNVVAIILQLQMINRVPITTEQRRGAEYDLWKKYGLEWINTNDDLEKRNLFLKKHRSYQRLIDKYGSPADLVQVAKPKSNLINCKILYTKTNEIIEKRIPYKISVQTLHGLVLKLFRHSIDLNNNGDTLSELKLSYVDSKRNDIKVKMDNLSKSLDFYSIQDGDCILVEWNSY